MKISELKTIAKENYYELKEEKEIEQITLERKVTFDGFISNVITISLIKKNLIFIKSKYCDDKDFNMIKAAVEFAETPIEDREEKTYRYEVFCEIDIKAKSKEEAIRKLEKDYGNYFSTYVGVVNEDGEVEEWVIQ